MGPQDLYVCLLFFNSSYEELDMKLSAAFDTIDHAILLRLEHVFGIHDTALHWFSSYLTNRTQTVTVNNCSSAPVTISCGIPQGSVLGPVLIILYTASLSLML